jgi:hypothetical protein
VLGEATIEDIKADLKDLPFCFFEGAEEVETESPRAGTEVELEEELPEEAASSALSSFWPGM